MNYQCLKAVPAFLTRFHTSGSKVQIFIPFCRYCANSSKLKEHLDADNLESGKDATKHNDLAAQSRDERLKSILANIKLKRTPLDQIIQNPAEQKGDQKSTGNEQFVSHAKLQARKEALNASKAFSEKVKGTKRKQIQNELAEMCEVALGAKDQLSDNELRVDDDFMTDFNQHNLDEGFDNAYENADGDQIMEQSTNDNVRDTSERENLSSTIDSTLLQTSKSAENSKFFSELFKGSKPKAQVAEKKVVTNEKVKSDKKKQNLTLMEAIAEHHARVKSSSDKDGEQNLGRARSPSPSKKKRRRKKKAVIESETQDDSTRVSKYGSKFQQSAEIKEGTGASGENLSDLIRRFPLPGLDAQYSGDGWTRQKQRETSEIDDYEEFFSNESIDEAVAGMSVDFTYDEEGMPDEHREWLTTRGPSRQTGYQRPKDDLLDPNASLFGQQRLNIFDVNFVKTKNDSQFSVEENVDNLSQSTWNVLLLKDTSSLFETPTRNGFEEMIKLTNQGKLWKFPIENEQGYEEEDNVPFHDHIFLEKYIQDFPKHPRIQTFMQVVCVGLSKNHKLTFTKKLTHLQMLKQYFEERFELLKTSAEFEESESIE